MCQAAGPQCCPPRFIKCDNDTESTCSSFHAPKPDVTVARTRRQNALDASTAPLYYYLDRVQHHYNFNMTCVVPCRFSMQQQQLLLLGSCQRCYLGAKQQ